MGYYDEQQLKQSIQITTAALVEANVKDEEVIRLLCKHYNMNTDSAVAFFMTEKTVYVPLRKLENYLILKKYIPKKEAQKIIIKNEVDKYLVQHPEAYKMTPGKLLEAASAALGEE